MADTGWKAVEYALGHGTEAIKLISENSPIPRTGEKNGAVFVLFPGGTKVFLFCLGGLRQT